MLLFFIGVIGLIQGMIAKSIVRFISKGDKKKYKIYTILYLFVLLPIEVIVILFFCYR